jgi:Flp pilus assembly protein TadB
MWRFYHRLRTRIVVLVDSGPMSYALKLAGAAIVLLFIGVLGILLFGNIWAQVGLGAALIVVFGGLLLIAWLVDRKDKAKRAGLDDLPDV